MLLDLEALPVRFVFEERSVLSYTSCRYSSGFVKYSEKNLVLYIRVESVNCDYSCAFNSIN